MAPFLPGIIMFGGASTYLTTITTTSSTILTETVWESLAYNYDSICTNFDHHSSSQTFTGKARLQGVVLHGSAIGPLDFTTIGPAPEVTLTIVNATYDPTASSGMFAMTGSLEHTLYQTYSRPYSLVEFSMTASGTFIASNSCVAAMQTTLVGNSVPAGFGSGTISLSRGGICPV
jgi:hypothetical protein